MHNSDKANEIKLERVLISGGGTGGHIFPAISIANAIRRQFPAVDILFVGADNRMEMERVPAAGYPIVGLSICGFDRKNLFRNFGVLLKLRRAISRARTIVKDFKPQVAIGVGGYASGPTLKAAQRLGIPTLIQEQNSYAGVTNKLLAKRAGRICVAYEGMNRFFPAENIMLTGNPVRKSLLENAMSQSEAKTALGFEADKPLVLVLGGSLGARTINQSIASSLDSFVESDIQLLWQTGKQYSDQAVLSKAASLKGIKVLPFISEMDIAYRAADIVVSRAGAGSISELQLLGKATILVPSPNVAEDHQRKNALALVRHQATVMIEDKDCQQKLAGQIMELVKDNQLRDTLSKNISAMAIHDSDKKIVDCIIELISNSK